jgi:REP element-mobilizing transposase RayT
MQTWLLLKTKNKSSHYKGLKQSYSKIAKSINVSESTLRNHIKQMVYEGFASTENNSLRLVSIWRNPIRFKTREYTKKNYGKIKKATINPLNLKLEVFQYQLKQQITRQNYRENEKNKLLGKKPKNKAKDIKRSLLIDTYENGKLNRVRERIDNNQLIDKSQKDYQFDMVRKGFNLICDVLSHRLVMNEGLSISKASQLSLSKLSDITGYSSKSSLRVYRNALKSNSGLTEELDFSIPLKNKKFSFKHHYKDKFGNIYRKKCIRYNVDTIPMEGVIKVRRNRMNNIL